jgi:hypothetical protein
MHDASKTGNEGNEKNTLKNLLGIIGFKLFLIIQLFLYLFALNLHFGFL